MKKAANCTKAELIERCENAELELSEHGDDLFAAVAAFEEAQASVRALLDLIDGGRLTLTDPAYSIEVRDAREALRIEL